MARDRVWWHVSVWNGCDKGGGDGGSVYLFKHKNILRWTQDVWLQWLISSGLLAPVLILNLSPKEIHRLFPWRPFTLLLSGSVCTALCLCAASLTQWDNVCISSYSQANPPPIIVNADSLDAGPYVSICICLSDCLFLWTLFINPIHTPPVCACLCARMCPCMCKKKVPPAFTSLFSVCAVLLNIHFLLHLPCFWRMCILPLCT